MKLINLYNKYNEWEISLFLCICVLTFQLIYMFL